jgi:hypothetical protein
MVLRRAGSFTCHWKGWALEIETFLGLKMATSEASSIPFKSTKIADKSDPSMMRSIEEPLSMNSMPDPIRLAVAFRSLGNAVKKYKQ